MIYKIHIDIFATTDGVRQALAQAKEHRDLAKSRVNLFDGGIAKAVPYYAENPTPPVVIVEETGSDAELMAHLAGLAEVCEPGTKVIVVGQLNDIALYRTLMSQGVSEYLVTPITAQQVLDTIRVLFEDPAAAPRGKLFAFFGARGGVGSSTLAQNVAWLLSEQLADDVIYIDLDLPFGTSGLGFNIDSKQNLGEALAQPDRVDVMLLERFLTKYGDHLQVLMAAGDLRAASAIDVDALEKVLEVTRQMASHVVVDVPHVWEPWTEAVLRSADDLVIVAQPDLANLRDTKNIVDTVVAKRGDSLPSRIVLNRVDAYKKTQLSPKDFQENLGKAPALSIPFDPNLFGTASNNGQMLAEAAKTHKVVDSLRQLSAQMVGRAPATAKRPNVVDWFKGELGKSKKRG